MLLYGSTLIFRSVALAATLEVAARHSPATRAAIERIRRVFTCNPLQPAGIQPGPRPSVQTRIWQKMKKGKRPQDLPSAAVRSGGLSLRARAGFSPAGRGRRLTATPVGNRVICWHWAALREFRSSFLNWLHRRSVDRKVQSSGGGGQSQRLASSFCPAGRTRDEWWAERRWVDRSDGCSDQDGWVALQVYEQAESGAHQKRDGRSSRLCRAGLRTC